MSRRRPVVLSNAATADVSPGAAQAPHMAPYDGTSGAAIGGDVAPAGAIPAMAAAATATSAPLTMRRRSRRAGIWLYTGPHCARWGVRPDPPFAAFSS